MKSVLVLMLASIGVAAPWDGTQGSIAVSTQVSAGAITITPTSVDASTTIFVVTIMYGEKSANEVVRRDPYRLGHLRVINSAVFRGISIPDVSSLVVQSWPNGDRYTWVRGGIKDVQR